MLHGYVTRPVLHLDQAKHFQLGEISDPPTLRNLRPQELAGYGLQCPRESRIHPITYTGAPFGRFYNHRSGETLSSNLQPRTQVSWEARGLWDPLLLFKPMYFLQLCAVTEQIRWFTKMLKSGTHLREWDDNKAVVANMNAMKPNSWPLVQELRVLHHLLRKLGIPVEVRYLLSGPHITAAHFRQLEHQCGENPTADGVISGDYRPIRRRHQEKFRQVQQRIFVSCLPQIQRTIA